MGEQVVVGRLHQVATLALRAVGAAATGAVRCPVLGGGRPWGYALARAVVPPPRPRASPPSFDAPDAPAELELGGCLRGQTAGYLCDAF